MFLEYTFQDWQESTESPKEYAHQIVKAYRNSEEFRRMRTAQLYFNAQNEAIAQKYILKATTWEHKQENGTVVVGTSNKPIEGNRIYSDFFKRFVIQQNMHLLANGVSLGEESQKEKLGLSFDKTLAQMGEKALIHGVCYGYWNVDHIEPLPAYLDDLSGFVALVDEQNSSIGVGIQFWQLNSDRPLYMRVFEHDGVTVYKAQKSEVTELYPKRAYKQLIKTDAAGEVLVGGENYSALPILPLYANPEKASELTEAIKRKIDAYDVIISDFCDNLEQTNEVYWAINNYGGTEAEVLRMLAKIKELKAVVSVSDGMGGGSTAAPHSFQVPHEARSVALALLEKQLYQDYQALSMTELTGGSLTNVAIQTAMLNLNLKADRYEWQVFSFVQGVLKLQGIETEQISFKRQDVVNRSEIVHDIYAMRHDIDQNTALRLNPYIMQEEINEIIENVLAEGMRAAEMEASIATELEKKQREEAFAVGESGNGENREENQ